MQVLGAFAAELWFGVNFNFSTPTTTRIELKARRTGDPYNLNPTDSSLPAAVTATVIANGEAAWNY